MKYTIYTDGACSGNPGPGGWGAVIFDENKKRLTDDEVSRLSWRDCEFTLLVSIRSLYVNSGSWGCVASVEAAQIRRLDECPFLEDDAENLA